MQSVQNYAQHQAPPDRLRERAISRRASVSAEVARVLASLAFPEPDRDRVMVVPAVLTGAAHG